MARSFRYYGKKRGNRRTGSPSLASAGEALFFAVILLLGCGGMGLLFATLVVPEWRVNYEFVQHPCRVVGKRIGERPSEDGPLYRPEVKIEFEVDGVIYSDWHYDIQKAYSNSRENAQAVLNQFVIYDKTKDNLYDCWYNPADPREAVLVRGYRWWVWLVFTVPMSFILIGAGGLIYALLHLGKSAERRAAMVQRAKERDLFAVVSGPPERRYPFVPEGADVTNSPGTRLRFRLPVARSVGWALFGLLAFCLLWNAGVTVAVVVVVRGIVGGKPEWFLLVFLVPFVAIGLGAVFFLVRKLLITTGIGTTFVEVSDHPLQPGGHYRVFLSQSGGQLRVNTFCVSLVCEEWAAYRQGTNTRTETQAVFREEIYRREAFEIQRGLPFEAEFELNVPNEAMHSFIADHNQVNWTLVLEEDVAKWPNFHRAFTVIVRPAHGESDT